MISPERQYRRESRAAPHSQEVTNPPTRARTFGWPAVASATLIAYANLLALASDRLPFLGPAIGFWFLVIQPVYLLYTTSVWRGTSPIERLGYSITAVLLFLMVAGLGINTLLPLVGVQRPLDPIPIVLVGDAMTLALYLFRRKYPAKIRWRGQLRAMAQEESRLIVGSGLAVLLAVMGANRLNNGAGDLVSLVALACMIVTLLLLLYWQQQVREGITACVLYLLSLALLLMNSLRGWFITGHDIQVEYRVFQLTEAHAHWSMSYFRDAYNACLSLTILPTEISQIVRVDNPYIYKLFFQMFFALCPVLVYAIARRYWSARISVLAAVYFIGFPTFINDMTFINRQEIAFLFVCVAFLSITNVQWGLLRRQLSFYVAALGIELSHYSTMYVFLGTLALAWAAQFVSGLASRRREGGEGAGRRNRSWNTKVQTVGLGSILVVFTIIFAWGQLATQTERSALTTAESAITGLVGPGGVRAGDVGYGLLFGKTLSPQAVLNNYHQAAFKQRSVSPSSFVAASVVDRYKTPIVSDLPSLPLTKAGHLLADVGIPPSGLNQMIRAAAAKGEQIFLILGLITFVVFRGLRQHISTEVFFLCVGSALMVAIITLFPNLSVDYGVTRAFQESLILLGPMLVGGSLTLFSFTGTAWAGRLSAAVVLGIFVSTSGFLPQVLGGYPAQLNLNNSGSYYNIDYMHYQEVAAVAWLGSEPGVVADGVQAAFNSERFAFTSPSDVTGLEGVTGIYPPLVKKQSWLVVSYWTMHADRSTFFYDGDQVTYVYPLKFLQNSKNLVYNNGGAEIYK